MSRHYFFRTLFMTSTEFPSTFKKIGQRSDFFLPKLILTREPILLPGTRIRRIIISSNSHFVEFGHALMRRTCCSGSGNIWGQWVSVTIGQLGDCTVWYFINNGLLLCIWNDQIVYQSCNNHKLCKWQSHSCSTVVEYTPISQEDVSLNSAVCWALFFIFFFLLSITRGLS